MRRALLSLALGIALAAPDRSFAAADALAADPVDPEQMRRNSNAVEVVPGAHDGAAEAVRSTPVPTESAPLPRRAPAADARRAVPIEPASRSLLPDR